MAQFEFSKEDMNDLIYAAREAEIRFKRLRTKTKAEVDAIDADRFDYIIEDCNEKIAHYNNLEKVLKNKYREAFGEYW